MTSKPAYNALAFARAKLRLSQMGHAVVTPLEVNSHVWARHHGRPFDPERDRCDYGDPLLKEMFAADIAELLSRDGIALLDGWRESKGATAEVGIARLFGLAVLDEYGIPIDETVLQEATRVVSGARGDDYGHPLDNHGRTAAFWSTYLGQTITPEQVCMMNALQKVSRSMNRITRDSLVDIAGYARNIEMIQDERARRNPDEGA